MGYTKQEILSECERAFQNKSTFYKRGFVNYRGRTTDTKEYYTEVVAAFLCEHIAEYTDGIKPITRKSSYKTEGHAGEHPGNTNRKEEIIAMRIFTQSRNIGPLDHIGQVEDYQTPLKSTARDVAGKIDLLAFDGDVMRLLELKRPDSKETMLRSVLEGYTYLKTVDCRKLVSDFDYDPDVVTVKACPFVFRGGAQHREMGQDRPYLKKLMEFLDSKPYYAALENGIYTVTED
jgi:hypothetical protein